MVTAAIAALGPLHPTHPEDMADPRGRPWACQMPEQRDGHGHWALKCDGCYVALVAAANHRPNRGALSTKGRRLPLREVLNEANRARAKLGLWTVA